MSAQRVAVGYTRLGTAIPTGFVAVLMFLLSFAEPSGRAAGGTSQVVTRICILVGSAFFGFVCLRALSAGVVVDDHGVLIRNVFRTLRLPIEAVDHFDIGVGFLGSGTCGVVVLSDGGQIRATMLGGASEITENSALRRAVEGLNQQLMQSRR